MTVGSCEDVLLRDDGSAAYDFVLVVDNGDLPRDVVGRTDVTPAHNPGLWNGNAGNATAGLSRWGHGACGGDSGR